MNAPARGILSPMDNRGSHQVRQARTDEAVAVSDLWVRSRLASIPAIPRPMHSNDEVRDWFAAVVLPTYEVWVAEAENRLIAVLVLDEDRVDQLYVDPEWFGRGVGSQLVDHAKQLRPSGLDLWTFQSNERARRFYERHGFRAQEMTDGDNEEHAPDVRYLWTNPISASFEH